ncbi:CIA30 family protein [Verrucomicrobiaceae bacterium 227]
MKKTIFLLLAFLGSSFATAEIRSLLPAKTKVEMGITNDGVMGGLSKGKITKTDQGTYLFSGDLSLQNNGGFSSLRMTGGDWNLNGWQGIEIEVKGDGRTYDLRLTTDEQFRGSSVSFSGKFETKKGEWTKVRVPFSALKATWRGIKLDRNFSPAKIEGLGITIADKVQGPFKLEFRSLAAWK